VSDVCAECVSDEYLRKYIDDDGIEGECSYCKKGLVLTIPVVELADLAERMLEEHFSPTNSEPEGIEILYAKEGKWEQAGEPLEGVLFEHVSENEDLVRGVATELQDRWFDAGSFEHRYGEEPHFEERSPGHGKYGQAWAEAESKLRYESRLLTTDTTTFLDSLFPEPEVNELTTILTPGEHRLFRARIFQSDESLEIALRDPEANLGPPPPRLARAGRMNAHGIAAFYGANDIDTAVAEVRPPVGTYALIGAFVPLRDLRILDLTKMIAATDGGSVFDPNTLGRVQRASFLRSFAAKLGAAVVPEREADDYLITQAIADYLSSREDLGLDGILYESVQLPGGSNVSLFHKASRISNNAHVVDEVRLYEPTEDADFFPALSEASERKGPESNKFGGYVDNRQDALALDRQSLEVRKVMAARFDTHVTKITVYAPAD
jgi:hypothetical protein